jgi:hypothetical protein
MINKMAIKENPFKSLCVNLLSVSIGLIIFISVKKYLLIRIKYVIDDAINEQ